MTRIHDSMTKRLSRILPIIEWGGSYRRPARHFYERSDQSK